MLGRNEKPSKDCDVAIVGAGPAGAQLALRLSREGFHVVLLDRQRFPRVKPCGEFMSPECLPILQELNLREQVLAHGAQCLYGMRLHGHGVVTEGRYRSFGKVQAPCDHGYAIRREVLDHLTLNAARAHTNVEVHEHATVRELLRDERGSVCGVRFEDDARENFELRARWTIGADGIRSVVARELGVQRAVPGLDKFAIVARYAGVEPADHAEVHFFPDGYIAAAPVDGGLFTLNLVIERNSAPRGGYAGLAAELQQHIDSAPALQRRLGGQLPAEPLLACGPLARRTTQQVFDGAALVGDACSFVDPMTGEGLYYAMRGATILADALVPALRAGRIDQRSIASYVQRRKQEILPRQRVARWMQVGLRHPFIVKSFLQTLRWRPQLADLVIALAGDYLAPRDLLRPSLWWDLLRKPRGLTLRTALSELNS